MLERPLPSDTPEMARLHAACFEDEVWTASQLASSLNLPTTESFLARDGGEIAGFILCQKAGDEAEILTFCVAPSHRRQGYGRKLLEPFLSEKGLILHLEVASDNEAARALYESAGFQKVGTRPNYYKRGEKSIDGVRYVRNLNG